MVEKGLQPSDPTTSRIEYKVGNVEELEKAGIGEGEAGVDLVIAGEPAPRALCRWKSMNGR